MNLQNLNPSFLPSKCPYSSSVPSPVDLAKDDVERADDGDDVGEHGVLADVVDGGEVREAGCLDIGTKNSYL